MPLTLSTPLSLYSIPVVWYVGIWPVRRRVGLINRTIGFDNKQPRGNLDRLSDLQALYPEQTKAAERMEGAHKNGTEILPLWIGAVLAANQVGLDDYLLNIASVAFIGIRILYNYVYINQKTDKQATLRSAIWIASLSIPMTLIVKSANKIRALKA